MLLNARWFVSYKQSKLLINSFYLCNWNDLFPNALQWHPHMCIYTLWYYIIDMFCRKLWKCTLRIRGRENSSASWKGEICITHNAWLILVLTENVDRSRCLLCLCWWACGCALSKIKSFNASLNDCQQNWKTSLCLSNEYTVLK